MFIQYLQVQNNAAILLSHWHGRRRIFQLCARTGEGEGEGAELGPSQGGQKHPWTPTLIYALMMRLWKVLTLITDFLAWSVNSALESSWLGTSNVLLFVDAWLRQRKNTYIFKKKKKRYQTKYFKGTEMAQWWEHPPPTALAWVRPSDLTSHVDHAHPWGFFRFSFIHKINVLNSTRTFTQTQILLTKLHIDWLFMTFHFLHLDSHLRIRRRRTI